MALRTFTRASVFLAGATTIAAEARIEPPFKEPLLDDGGAVSQPWNSWFTGTSDRLADIWGFLNSGKVSAGVVIMQAGTGTSDPAGLLSVTLPLPYSTRTLTFECDGHPAEPAAFFNLGSVAPLPLDVITGTLSKDVGGGTIIPVPNAPFTWFATGV